jgi:hypothetical protein
LDQRCLGPHDALVAANDKAFDVSLSAASWDSRSTAMTRCFRPPHENLGLVYGNPGANGYAAINQATLVAWTEEHQATFDRVSFDSARVPSSFREVIARLERIRDRSSTPLRLLTDLSAMPRYVSLGLLSRLEPDDLFSSITFIYETSSYDVGNRDGNTSSSIPVKQPVSGWSRTAAAAATVLRRARSIFTRGSWRCIGIPGLDRVDELPSRTGPKHCVVALGFDGEETYEVLRQLDVGRVTAIVPDPPVREEFVERCLAANNAVLSEWVSATGLFRCGATDARGMVNLLARIPEDDCPRCYLPFGTRPHALGMAVEALSSRSAMVLYRWPQSFVERSQISRGIVYAYTVTVERASTAGVPGPP